MLIIKDAWEHYRRTVLGGRILPDRLVASEVQKAFYGGATILFYNLLQKLGLAEVDPSLVVDLPQLDAMHAEFVDHAQEISLRERGGGEGAEALSRWYARVRPSPSGNLLGALRVAVFAEGDISDVWYAQGLEIDYLTQGESEADVQERFERGLTATVYANIDRFGSTDRMLHAAPRSHWADFYRAKILSVRRGNPLSTHLPLPFSSTVYYTCRLNLAAQDDVRTRRLTHVESGTPTQVTEAWDRLAREDDDPS